MNIHEVAGKSVSLEWIVEDGQRLCVARLVGEPGFMADGSSEEEALADMAEALGGGSRADKLIQRIQTGS